jgi:patatin-like phospholipase/acyl hydrolase
VLSSVRLVRQFLLSVSVMLASLAVHAQDLPWHLGSIDQSHLAAPAAINTASMKPGSHEVVVAVIDSGVIATHPSLEGRLLPGYDLLSCNYSLQI